MYATQAARASCCHQALVFALTVHAKLITKDPRIADSKLQAVWG
ncbi:MAG TPA: hypothetical protein VJU61_20060 [Polyangiaceae bacterium]|nr:hypothetical protein [Polyangiaceae bacterium]